jgi:hypothetical protein
MFRLMNAKRGSMTFMLVSLMLLVLGMILLVVQTGRINLNRTHTANAADAGALAGATTYANMLNSIFDMSNTMFATAFSAQIALAMCLDCGMAFFTYATYIIAEIAMYIYAMSLTKVYSDQADFMNEIKDGKGHSKFTWKDVSGGESYVHVDVQGPGRIDLIPIAMGVDVSGAVFGLCFPNVKMIALGTCVYVECCCCCCYCGCLPGIWGIAFANRACNDYKVTVKKYEPPFSVAGQTLDYGVQESTSRARPTNMRCSACGNDDCCEYCVLPQPLQGGEYDSKLVGGS